MANKFVYLFSEGNGSMRELLGGKGANLAEMTNLGMPVPQGFTITTEACTQYYEDGEKINDEIQAQIMEYITKMEEITGKKFGDLENPLLVSVRSGARASMPGMMDTILNLGLNEDVVEVIAKKSNNPRWAWDCYRRFIQMYSDVVMEVGKKYFEELIDEMKAKRGVTQDVDMVDVSVDVEELAARLVVGEQGPRGRAVGRGVPADRRDVGGVGEPEGPPLFELHGIGEIVDGPELTGILAVGAAHADALVARAVLVHVGLLVKPRLLHAEHRRCLVGEHRRNGLFAVVPTVRTVVARAVTHIERHDFQLIVLKSWIDRLLRFVAGLGFVEFRVIGLRIAAPGGENEGETQRKRQ